MSLSERLDTHAEYTECRCPLPPHVRHFGGMHIKRLDEAATRDLLLRRYLRRESQPVKQETFQSILRVVEAEIPLYVDTDLVVATCPSYEAAERRRAEQARSRRPNKRRASTFEEA